MGSSLKLLTGAQGSLKGLERGKRSLGNPLLLFGALGRHDRELAAMLIEAACKICSVDRVSLRSTLRSLQGPLETQHPVSDRLDDTPCFKKRQQVLILTARCRIWLFRVFT